MNYEIIKNKERFDQFLEWLPELEDGQKFYVSLFARKKYCKTEGLKSDKCQLKRLAATKEQLYNKIKKLEVELGSYEIDGVKINQDSLALYITPNPRDMHLAGLKTIQDLTKLLVEGRKIYNPQSVALNMIQVSGVKKYFDIDIDFRPDNGCSYEVLLDKISKANIINPEAIIGNIVKTRGGFHILVELSKISPEYKNSWYKGFINLKCEIFDVMMNSDGLIPMPGCVQSDYSPILMK